jgi:Putative Ig domain
VNAALYNPTHGTFTATHSLPAARSGGSIALLPDGSVLYVGGSSKATITPSAAVFRYTSSGWSYASSLLTPASDATLTVIGGGLVLDAGGYNSAERSESLLTETFFAGIPPTLVGPTSANVTVGNEVSLQFAATGGPTPTVAVGGALPSGLGVVVQSGAIVVTGVPQSDTAGVYTVPVTASNGVGAKAVTVLTFVVSLAPLLGYRILTANGRAFGFGGVESLTPSRVSGLTDVVAIGSTYGGDGYYLVSSTGTVRAYGKAVWQGDLTSKRTGGHVVAFATSPDFSGYYLATANGRIFNFGDAGFYGSAVHTRLRSRITSIAVTPDGRGYWLLGADVTILNFGDAAPMSSLRLNPTRDEAVALAPTLDGRGLYVVSQRGAVYTLGDAVSYGAVKSKHPIVSFALTPDGKGYYLLAASGGVFVGGDARNFGSIAHRARAAAPLAIAAAGWFPTRRSPVTSGPPCHLRSAVPLAAPRPLDAARRGFAPRAVRRASD